MLVFSSDEYFERYFGCEGDFQEKPELLCYFNPFILKGRIREVTPKENSERYIDHHKYYHIREREEFTKEEVYVAGYKIKTHGEGDFQAQYIIRTPNTVKTHRLKIRVREKTGERMKCAVHENCYIKPKQENNHR